MTPEQATGAWLRYLLRVGPKVDGAVLRWIAEELAGDTEPGELLALSRDLAAIAGVVAEEADLAPARAGPDRLVGRQEA